MNELDLSTCEDWNLRALLLRLLADEWWQPWKRVEQDSAGFVARQRAVALGLVTDDELTPLGRKFAEALRPEPWRVADHVAGWLAVAHESANGTIICESKEDATHIAVLLSANDGWKAKQHRSVS